MLRKVDEITKDDVCFNGFFDFGQNAYSTLEVELDTDFAENVEIIVGEVACDGHIVHPTNYCTFIQNIIQTGIGHNVLRFNIHDYIPAYGCNPHCPTPPDVDGEFAPFRYVEVNRHYGKVTVRRTAYYPDWDDSASDFQCSDTALKKVWNFCKYSIKAESVFDRYVDGERERMPYEGDAFINQLGHFCCDASYSTARNTIDHFFEYGSFTWPVEWLLLTPLLARDYWLYSGDNASVARWLPLLDDKLLLDYLNKDSLLDRQVYKEKSPDRSLRDIVDWPESEQDGYDFSNVNFVPNAYLYGALLAMHELTGKDKYLELANAQRLAIRRHFLKDGVFVDSLGSSHTALHTAMFALYFQLCEEDEIDAHRKIILGKGMDCSVYGAQFLLETCFRHGMAEHAVALMTSSSKRSWLNMMREGATTAMESWGDECKQNQDWTHAWGAAPANIITRCLCGIRPQKPAFAEFIVDPQPGNLAEFKVRQMTPKGAIELEWSSAKKTLSVPPGTVAIFKGRRFAEGIHELN